MNKILGKECLAPATTLLIVEAPEIAAKALPGQFVIVRIREEGERVPLTIADFDRAKGTLTIVFQEIGKSTKMLGCMKEGGAISDVVGPLGQASEIENFGRVVCVGGGLGIAPVYPIARALKEAGNRLTSIIGARNEELLFYEDELGAVSDEVIVMTDDGSRGRQGVVTVPLVEMCEAGGVDRVIAIGPAIMMKFVALATKPFGVKTIVSLNPIMVDGTGMCGACRVAVGGKTRFGCVDGPEFDGHEVDWDLLMARQRTYVDEEKQAMEGFSCTCG